MKSVTDTVRREPARAYRDTFAPTDPAEPRLLPPGWHKLYFTALPPLAQLRPDGTPIDDDLLPAIDLPRRLYAGEELIFHRPIRFGETLELVHKPGLVTRKRGSSGELVFATLESSILAGAEIVTTIRAQDVFLGPSLAPSTARRQLGPAPRDWVWSTEVTLTPVHLFRFSALTGNSHRVHYDRDWARGVEGQPDLLVHGPLLELLLLDFCARSAPGRDIAHLLVRVVSPAYVDTPVRLVGIPSDTGAHVWALDVEGGVLVTGEVDWA